MTSPKSARRTFSESRARELFDSGLGCNAIARAMGCSASSVSGWAKSAGLSFEESARVRAASVVRKMDLRAERDRLAQRLVGVADVAIDRVTDPYELAAFTGKDGQFNSQILAKAPADAVRNFAVSATSLYEKINRTVEQDRPLDSPEASMLAALGRALGIVSDNR